LVGYLTVGKEKGKNSSTRIALGIRKSGIGKWRIAWQILDVSQQITTYGQS
jgi:hypothetical protein